MSVYKVVNLKLVGIDGNAFSLMGAFQSQARKEGWTKEEIDKVLTECQSGDYDHLVFTLSQYCKNAEFEIDKEEDECSECGYSKSECNCEDE